MSRRRGDNDKGSVDDMQLIADGELVADSSNVFENHDANLNKSDFSSGKNRFIKLQLKFFSSQFIAPSYQYSF